MYTSIKESFFATTQKVNKRTWKEEDVFSPGARVIQMSFDTSDGYVNTLTVADFNLFSRAIQGDIHRFELIERFIKVWNLLWCAF